MAKWRARNEVIEGKQKTSEEQLRFGGWDTSLAPDVFIA